MEGELHTEGTCCDHSGEDHGDRPKARAAKLYALAAVATPVGVEIAAAQFRVFSERPYPRGPATGEENGLKNDQQRCHKVQAAYLRPEQPEMPSTALGRGLLGLFNSTFTAPAAVQPKISSDSSVASDASTSSTRSTASTTRSFSEHMAYAYQNGADPAFKDLVRSISNLSDDGY